MCCHLAPATQPERVMKSGEATREAAVTIRPGATCGAPPAQCHAHAGQGRRSGALGEGPPGPRRAGGTFRASWCPKEPGPLALAGLGFRSPGGAGPVSPCSSPPTHTHTMLTLGFADRLPRESFDRTFIFKAKLRVTTGWARRDCRGSGRDSSPRPPSLPSAPQSWFPGTHGRRRLAKQGPGGRQPQSPALRSLPRTFTAGDAHTDGRPGLSQAGRRPELWSAADPRENAGSECAARTGDVPCPARRWAASYQLPRSEAAVHDRVQAGTFFEVLDFSFCRTKSRLMTSVVFTSP